VFHTIAQQGRFHEVALKRRRVNSQILAGELVSRLRRNVIAKLVEIRTAGLVNRLNCQGKGSGMSYFPRAISPLPSYEVASRFESSGGGGDTDWLASSHHFGLKGHIDPSKLWISDEHTGDPIISDELGQTRCVFLLVFLLVFFALFNSFFILTHGGIFARFCSSPSTPHVLKGTRECYFWGDTTTTCVFLSFLTQVCSDMA